MRTLIHNATIVNEGQRFKGSLVIHGTRIAEILEENEKPKRQCDQIIDATGLFLLPGVIDDHVHFREPGLTDKGSIATESRAAAAGGVTSFMDMPNTKPQTTTLAALRDKFHRASRSSVINYSFYFGATSNNFQLFDKLNTRRVCGLKLFMGASTGNMLVNETNTLEEIFRTSPLPIAVHCEDSNIIEKNIQQLKKRYGDNLPIEMHPIIRSCEVCTTSTKQAIELANRFKKRLHILHISTAEEVNMLTNLPLEEKLITAEACPSYLIFSEEEYSTLGARIKCNPAIKGINDREALREALNDGRIDVIGTDHAPHLIADKQGGALTATSGMPMIQYSLVSMLKLCDEGITSIENIVEKMCHAPAKLFKIDRRGYLKKDYHADFVLVSPNEPWILKKENIASQCGWSPLEDTVFNWKVRQTWVNGEAVYADGNINSAVRGRALTFLR